MRYRRTVASLLLVVGIAGCSVPGGGSGPHDGVSPAASRRAPTSGSPRPSSPTPLSFPATATALPAGAKTIPLASFRRTKANVGSIAISQDAVWVTGNQEFGSGGVRFDPRTDTVTARLRLDDLSVISAADGDVWASRYHQHDAVQFDDATGRLRRTVALALDSAPTGVAVARGSAWVAEHHGAAIVQLDATTGERRRVVAVPDDPYGPGPDAAGFGTVWVFSGDRLFRIDERTGRIDARIRTGPDIACCVNWAFTPTLAWGAADSQLTAFDPATNRIVANYSIGLRTVTGLAAAGDTVWLLSYDGTTTPSPGGHSTLIGLRTDGTVTADYDLGAGVADTALASGFGSLWLAGGPGDHDLLRLPVH